MTKRNFKKILWGVGVVSFLLVGFMSAQATDLQINPIVPNIPGTNEATQENPNPVGIVGNLFQFALLIGGLLAFVMIVWGGIEYASSGDSGSGQKEAKDRIQQALLGLLLLAGAFVLLQTINPNLTKLYFPTLSDVVGSEVDLPNTTGPNGVCPTGTTIQNCVQQSGAGAYCHQGSCYAGNGGPFAGIVGAPKEKGGRCIDNQCNAGLFCFRDNKCYEKIAGCSMDDNEFNDAWGILTNSGCRDKYKQITGIEIKGAVCTNNFCEELDDFDYTRSCSGDPTRCQSGTSCVSGVCKLNGTEGARCLSSTPFCVESGVQCDVVGVCVRELAEDTPCGDQIGTCEQGSCQMDRVNIGKYICSATPGPDGICPSSMGGGTPQAIQNCVSAFGPIGGYCHAQGCYRNDNPSGPFPGMGPFPSNP